MDINLLLEPRGSEPPASSPPTTHNIARPQQREMTPGQPSDGVGSKITRRRQMSPPFASVGNKRRRSTARTGMDDGKVPHTNFCYTLSEDCTKVPTQRKTRFMALEKTKRWQPRTPFQPPSLSHSWLETPSDQPRQKHTESRAGVVSETMTMRQDKWLTSSSFGTPPTEIHAPSYHPSQPYRSPEQHEPTPLVTTHLEESRDPLFDTAIPHSNPDEKEFDFDAMFGDAMEDDDGVEKSSNFVFKAGEL